METKANYTLVGIFTIAVVAAVFGFVYWSQHVGGTGERATYRVLFSSSVSGLRTGSAVLFNGIRVGDVTDLRLNPDNPAQVAAVISIDKKVKVRPDTRAGIEFQGLTGIAAVALNGGSPGEPALNGLANPPPALVVCGGLGFCAQNDRRLHFGLGKASKVEKVEIRWQRSGEEMVREVTLSADNS